MSLDASSTDPSPLPWSQDAAGRWHGSFPSLPTPALPELGLPQRGEAGGTPIPGWPGTNGDLRRESWRISCSSAKFRVPAAAVREESKFYDSELHFGINEG